MADPADLVAGNAEAFARFVAEGETLAVVRVDADLAVIAANRCLAELIGAEGELAGRPFPSLLLPESQAVLPLPAGEDELVIWLNFSAADRSAVSLHCRISRCDDDGYLVLGGHLVLTSEQVLQKMTVLTNELANLTRDLQRQNRALEEARAEVKVLSGLLPICMHCKKIRDDEGYWGRIEEYIEHHSEAAFSHGICPDCLEQVYPDQAKRMRERRERREREKG